MQTGRFCPWFGVGHALERFLSERGAALPEEMRRGLPLFMNLLGDVETGMAKADLGIARRYAGLVGDEHLRERVFGMIAEEFERTRRVILRVSGQTRLLERTPCSPLNRLRPYYTHEIIRSNCCGANARAKS